MARSVLTDPLANLGWRPGTWGKWLAALTLATVAIGLGAGTSTAQGTGPTPGQAAQPSPEESLVLRHRAAEYWAARVARDYRTQWELSEPRLKGRTTPEDYARGKGAIEYLGYEVGDASINGSFASVHVKVIGRVTLPNSRAKPVVKTATVPDAWIKVDGIWYRRADQPEGQMGPSGQMAPPGTVQ
jgi:hypothetical protein